MNIFRNVNCLCNGKQGVLQMGKKKNGHFCNACGRSRPNEKFSGKGHRQHICKDCKRKGELTYETSTSEYDREVNNLNKAIRKCLIVYSQSSSFILFEYQRARYITRDDFESEIFIYQANVDQKFLVDKTLKKNEAFMDVLVKKYYECINNRHVVDCDDELERELLVRSKKRQQHIEVILSINNLVYKDGEPPPLSEEQKQRS